MSPLIPTRLALGVAAAFASTAVLAAPTVTWTTVVNNGTAAPATTTGAQFFSYNQPSVNDLGLVVFRARARPPVGEGGSGGGGTGEPVRGIFTRDMSTPGAPVTTIASNKAPFDVVPQPNNTGGTFNEMPSFPRIDAQSKTIAFRGQSSPVFEFQTGIDGSTGEPITTKGGTSGVYTNPQGTLVTGASLLGNVNNATFPANPNLSYFQVPGTTPGTRFDQFPGAPTVTGNTVAFKGNWTDPATGGQTGIYVRDVVASSGLAPVVKVAASGDTFQTGQAGSPTAVFGSTAPPSASNGQVAFLGLDNEAAPTAGGIFVSSLSNPSSLKSLVRIGVSAVGNGISDTFKTIGEALSFDGNKIAFWGSWGNNTKQVTLNCPTDGNASLVAACRNNDNNGVAGDGIYTFAVPEDQGIFVVDTGTGAITMKARTGSEFDDFLFWNFSGAPDDAGSEDADQEPPRWRSNAFIAEDDFNTVFKAVTAGGTTGLYGNFGTSPDDTFTLAEIGMDGGLIDANAAGMSVTSLGIERDGFRNGWLAINAGMANADTSWAGIYVTHIPEPETVALTLAGLLAIAARRRRRED